MPPAQAEDGDDHRPALGVGVDHGGEHAQSDADGAPQEGQEDGFGKELDADMALGGSEGAAQPDLASSFQDGDDHDVGHADGSDEQGDRTQAQEERVEGALGVSLGHQGGRGLTDIDLVGGFGVGGGGQHGLDGGDLVALGPHVNGRRVPVEAEIGLCGGEADQHRRVDLGGQHGRLQGPGQVEPLVVEPDPFAWIDVVDPEALGGRGPEYRHGLLRGGGVEVAALGHRRADRAQQPETGRLDRQRVGVDGGDEGAAIDVDVVDALRCLPRW